jgi:hypothetical protein
MFQDEEITAEDEDQVIEWMAKEFYKYGLEAAAILFLESGKPLAFIGSQIGSVFVMPFLPFFGDTAYTKGDRFFKVFQKHENVERLIKRLEELSEKGPRDVAREQPTVEQGGKAGTGQEERKGWRKYLPF